MPANPWLAIDSATPPRVRARELRLAWEQFLGGGPSDEVRAPIADSWRRSEAAGVDPSGGRLAPVMADTDDTSARWDVHPLAAAAPLIQESLAAVADESAHLIVVSDADGVILWIDGNARVRVDAADSMNFVEGALWSETGAGTNAIGTALAADHAVQVFAAEHFNAVVQSWTCAAAPVRDPDSGPAAGHHRPHRQDVDRPPAQPRAGHDRREGRRVAPALRHARARSRAAHALPGADRERDPSARSGHADRPGPGLPARGLARWAAARGARRRRRADPRLGAAGLRGACRARGGVPRGRGRERAADASVRCCG